MPITEEKIVKIIDADVTDNQASVEMIGAQGALVVKPVGGLVIAPWDYLSATYPSGTQEVYTFKNGGSGGTTVAVVTVNYTDATKEFISDVTKV